jgi:hypothetical protein
MKVAEAPGIIAIPEKNILPQFLHCIKRFGIDEKFLATHERTSITIELCFGFTLLTITTHV